MIDPRMDTQARSLPGDEPRTQTGAPARDTGWGGEPADELQRTPSADATADRTAGAGTQPITVAGTLGEDAVALLDLPRWIEHLRALPTWHEGDRASSLLLRQPPVRVLLSALRGDAQLGSDGAEETVMMLVLSGAMQMEWRGEMARIGEREVAFVPAGGGWRVTSEAPETVLLCTFWGTPGTGTADEADQPRR